MLALRSFERIEGDDIAYDDSAKEGKRERRASRRGRSSPPAKTPLTPPPIKSNATPFDFGAYMQDRGIKLSLNSKGEMTDDEDDEDYSPMRD